MTALDVRPVEQPSRVLPPAGRGWRGRRPADERINWKTSWPFFLVHLLPFLAFFTGVTTRAVVLCIVLYFGRMFFITAGYHRYFAHRSYRMGRVPQFLMAFGGSTAAQKGALWWAAHHRQHHRATDTELDVHSPLKGIFWSHVGWILCNKYKDTDLDGIRDFAQYPELMWLERKQWLGPWLLGVASYLIAGWSGLVIGFFLSTVLLWHGTFLVNSAAHLFGRRRYATQDTSRNSLIVALFTGGEGWHNNHHYYPASARQGFFWFELDPTYYGLRALSLVGIVKDLRQPPARVKKAGRLKDGHFDVGMFRAHWSKATNTLGHFAMSATDIETKKQALEASVQSALRAADELARSSKPRRVVLPASD
ncbi:MAG TPA: acyl-CoA desaturase [Acidimicrobiales bacterium]|nr:acyl-CoA desaturase [Acidimicrobiales bacterium]